MNLPDEHMLLLACMDAGLPDSEIRPDTFNTLPDWDKLFNTALSQGLAPLVYKGIKDIPGRASVPPEIMDKLKAVYHMNIARNMHLYSEAERILGALKEAGIEAMLLKGAALAGEIYGDIGLRSMGDVDVLVRREDLPFVKGIMSELNYRADRNSRSEEWYAENHFHQPPYVNDKNSLTVEIHWHICQDSLGVDVDKWWKRAGSTRLGELAVLIPAPEDMILHLCISLYHGNYNKAALRCFCDISKTIRHFSGEMNWKLFRETVSRSEITRPVYSLLYLVRKYFPDNDPALCWVGDVQVDLKFTAMLEHIIFSPGEVSYGILIRSLAADTAWKRTKLIFAGRLFPSREEMSKRYPVRPDSAMVYLYYACRPFGLALKYGRSVLDVFRIRNSC